MVWVYIVQCVHSNYYLFRNSNLEQIVTNKITGHSRPVILKSYELLVKWVLTFDVSSNFANGIFKFTRWVENRRNQFLLEVLNFVSKSFDVREKFVEEAHVI
jgi:hypothetical protein